MQTQMKVWASETTVATEIPEEKPKGLDGWREMWEKGEENMWNSPRPHKFVTDSYEALLNGRKQVKIFFPLCGKDLHMRWFAERGHEVVGVEGVEVGVKKFFESQKIEYSCEDVQNVDNCKLYTSQEEKLKIKIFICDVMEYNSSLERGFDAVWDRGGFGAIPVDLRNRFCDIMLSDGMLKPHFRYFLETFVGKHQDSEEGVTEEDISKRFKVGEKMEMKRLVLEEYEEESDYKDEHGVGFFDQYMKEHKNGSDEKFWVQVHLLTKK